MRSFVYGLAVAIGLWFASSGALPAQSFAFTTAAGLAGTNGAGSANGTNSTARFHEPGSVAVDGAGNLYVADTSNHTIRKVTRAGSNWVVTTIAGSAGASGTNDGANNAARFFFPYGIAVDAQTNLYVADTYNHTIRKITPSGTNWVVSTLAGTPGSHGTGDGPGYSAGFFNPYGVAVDSLGNVFVADTYNHTVRMLVPMGTNCSVSTLAGSAGTLGIADGSNSVARFQFPCGVAAGPGTNVYVADTYNSTIRRITPSGTNWVVTTLAGFAEFNGFADATNSSALFNFPFGVAVDSATNLYVVDTDNDAIRQLTAFGTNWVATTIAGSVTATGTNDGAGSAALFSAPQGLAVDAAGKLYVADTFNNTIRVGRLGFSLQAALQGGQLVLSWPAAATNYVLETKATLAPGPWTPVTTGVFLLSNTFVKTNSVVAGSGYYRLHKP
jgi:sugar lactone lactonase YvrE